MLVFKLSVDHLDMNLRWTTQAELSIKNSQIRQMNCLVFSEFHSKTTIKMPLLSSSELHLACMTFFRAPVGTIWTTKINNFWKNTSFFGNVFSKFFVCIMSASAARYSVYRTVQNMYLFLRLLILSSDLPLDFPLSIILLMHS